MERLHDADEHNPRARFSLLRGNRQPDRHVLVEGQVHWMLSNGYKEEVVLERLQEHPNEAKEQNISTGIIPLHLAKTVALVQELLKAYPLGAQQKCHLGCLPIHDAVEDGKAPDVLRMLLRAYPDAALARDRKGRLPVQAAVDKKLPKMTLEVLLTNNYETAEDAINAASGQVEAAHA